MVVLVVKKGGRALLGCGRLYTGFGGAGGLLGRAYLGTPYIVFVMLYAVVFERHFAFRHVMF